MNLDFNFMNSIGIITFIGENVFYYKYDGDNGVGALYDDLEKYVSGAINMLASTHLSSLEFIFPLDTGKESYQKEFVA